MHTLIDTALGTLTSPIGFLGAVELDHGHGFGAGILWACLAAMFLSLALPVLGYILLRSVTKLDATIGIPLYEAAAQIVIPDDGARVASAQPFTSFREER